MKFVIWDTMVYIPCQVVLKLSGNEICYMGHNGLYSLSSSPDNHIKMIITQ